MYAYPGKLVSVRTPDIAKIGIQAGASKDPLYNNVYLKDLRDSQVTMDFLLTSSSQVIG